MSIGRELPGKFSRRHESPISPVRWAFSGVCGSLTARDTLVPVEPLMTPAVGLHPSTKTGGMPRKWIVMPLCYNLKLKQNSLPETDSPPSDAEAISNLWWNHGVRSTGHGNSTVVAESSGNLISVEAAPTADRTPDSAPAKQVAND